MTLDINKYETMCTKYKWIAKPHREQQIVDLSVELDNIKDNNLKWSKVLKSKVMPEVKTNKKIIQKVTKKFPRTEE